MKFSVRTLFAKYVFLNILSMIGVSCYVLADTFFISRSAGADGITVLNMSLPFYNLIYGLGQMVGIGASIRYSIDQNEERRNTYFTEALLWNMLFGAVFMISGGMHPAEAVRIMGGDAKIAALGAPYFRWMFLFAPAFMANYTVLGFVRNDGDPGICMAATVASSLFNILFDYILIFPAGLGFSGAALATAVSPLVSILIAGTHFLKKDNHIIFKMCGISFRKLVMFCRLGLSSFVTEMASGVTTTIFNFLILSITGNIGIAAYGVVANFAIVGNSLFNGLAQGSQPLISRFYASKDDMKRRQVFRMGIETSVMIAVILNILVFAFTDRFVALFNSEGSLELQKLAFPGLRIYFVGFFFSSINIFLASAFSAENQALPSAVISISRGFVAITICAFVLSHLFGMTGIFASYAVSELITLMIALQMMKRVLRKDY